MIRLISCDFKQELWHQIHRKKSFYTDKIRKYKVKQLRIPQIFAHLQRMAVRVCMLEVKFDFLCVLELRDKGSYESVWGKIKIILKSNL